MRDFQRILFLLSSLAFADRVVATELPVQCQPDKVLGAESCQKCHASEFIVWSKTPHALTFEKLHRDPVANAMAKKMGFASIKRGGFCMDCHYTVVDDGNKMKPISGISCESCHGAAEDWLTLHNDYGGSGANKQSESAEHKQQRRTNSIAHGMQNPSNVFLIARSCLGCHTVGNEQLVNIAGHKAGSIDFELVSWSQGSLRHNFVQGNGQVNVRSETPRLRVMYVSGLIADLEFSTRALSKATSAGTFGKSSAERSAKIAMRLAEIQSTVNHPILDEILTSFAEAELATNNASQLLPIADKIRELGTRFGVEETGENLAGIDSLLPPVQGYK